PALVTEKLAFQKLSRDGGAVYLDEGAGLAHAELVDGPGDEVLAGAGFTANEDGDVCPRRLANNFSYLQHPRTCPEGKLVPQPATGVVLRFSPGRTSRASNSRLDELLARLVRPGLKRRTTPVAGWGTSLPSGQVLGCWRYEKLFARRRGQTSPSSFAVKPAPARTSSPGPSTSSACASPAPSSR